ncbi:hypothetical protein AC481_03810 [miscellaneous Crenarchaeota group archaeon SMTZ-80]|nr:MAG: hypothetical protein AC481_03810 [miscellaneous Crenarchaeota group archaeon SMTZ-80]
MDNSKSPYSSYLIVFSGFLAALASVGFARFGYSMILPGMKDDLMLIYTQMGLIESSNFIGYLIFAFVGGMLATKYGPRRIITSSLLIVGTSMLLTGFAENFIQAFILRGFTGIGSGGANVSAMGLPAMWFSQKKRGLTAGIITSGAGGGLVLTGFLVPKLTQIYGNQAWRYSWIILGILTIVFAFVCWVGIRNPAAKKFSIDKIKGTGLKVVSSDTFLWKVGFVYSFFGLSYIIYVTFFGAYLVKEIGLTSQLAGILWALVGFLSLASGALWGHVSDRLGRAYGIALVYFVQSLAIFLFIFAGITELLYASVILFGMTSWSIASIVAAYSGDHFGSKLAFSAFGFFTLFFGIGQAIGPSIAGYIADTAKTFVPAFLFSSSMATIAGLLSLKMLKKA